MFTDSFSPSRSSDRHQDFRPSFDALIFKNGGGCYPNDGDEAGSNPDPNPGSNGAP